MLNNSSISTIIQTLSSINTTYLNNNKLNFIINQPFKDKNVTPTNNTIYNILSANNSIYLTPVDINTIKNIHYSSILALSGIENQINITNNNFFTTLPYTFCSGIYTANTIVSGFKVTYLNYQYSTNLSTTQEFIQYVHQYVINLMNEDNTKALNIRYFISKDGKDVISGGTWSNPFKTIQYALQILNTKKFYNSVTVTIDIKSDLIITEPIKIFHPDITSESNSQFYIYGRVNTNTGTSHRILIYQPTDINNMTMFNILSPCKLSKLTFQMSYKKLLTNNNNLKSTCLCFDNKAENEITNINIFNFSHIGILNKNYSICTINVPLNIIMTGADTNTLSSYEDPKIQLQDFKICYFDEFWNTYTSAAAPKLYENVSISAINNLEHNDMIQYIPHSGYFIKKLKENINNLNSKSYEDLYQLLLSSFDYITQSQFLNYNISQGVSFEQNYLCGIWNVYNYCNSQASSNTLPIFQSIKTIPSNFELANTYYNTMLPIFNDISNPIGDTSFNLISTKIQQWSTNTLLSAYINTNFIKDYLNVKNITNREKWLQQYTKIQLATSYFSGILSTDTKYIKNQYYSYYKDCYYNIYKYDQLSTQELLVQYVNGRPIFSTYFDYPDFPTQKISNIQITRRKAFLYAYVNICNNRYSTINYINTQNLIIPEIIIPNLISNKFTYYHSLSGQIGQSLPSTFYLEYAIASTAIHNNINSLNNIQSINLQHWKALYMTQASCIIDNYGFSTLQNILLTLINSIYHPYEGYPFYDFKYSTHNTLSDTQLQNKLSCICQYATIKLKEIYFISAFLTSISGTISHDLSSIAYELTTNEQSTNAQNSFWDFKKIYAFVQLEQDTEKPDKISGSVHLKDQTQMSILDTNNYLKSKNNSNNYVYGIYNQSFAKITNQCSLMYYFKNMNIAFFTTLQSETKKRKSQGIGNERSGIYGHGYLHFTNILNYCFYENFKSYTDICIASYSNSQVIENPNYYKNKQNIYKDISNRDKTYVYTDLTNLIDGRSKS